ncbi:MAG: patatin-like phospholipase family protein [Acidobacteria bacterium]|nr:patatin-like phospholipase family protein [Acidobacteriota bacterium]
MALYDMVFEGGGAKGSVFVGALRALKERGHTHRRLIGTSAGAITATLLAAGYDADAMLAAVNEKLKDPEGNEITDAQGNPVPLFSSFMDVPKSADFDQQMRDASVTAEIFRRIHVPGLPNWEWFDRKLLNAMLDDAHYRQLFSFVECGGLFAGDNFLNWLRRKLDEIGARSGNGVTSSDTFAEFNRKTQTDLSLVATDTTANEMLVLNHRTAPQLPVAWGVRMSMSIPFVWREVPWREEWGAYRDDPKTDEPGKGNIIVDGGVLSNFPIRLIVDEPAGDAEVAGVMGAQTVAGEAGNLGLLIDEALDVPGSGGAEAATHIVDKLRTAQRVMRLMDTMMQANDKGYINDHERFVCRLPAKGYGTTEFGMSDARLQALVRAGYDAMIAHLDKG